MRLTPCLPPRLAVLGAALLTASLACSFGQGGAAPSATPASAATPTPTMLAQPAATATRTATTAPTRPAESTATPTHEPPPTETPPDMATPTPTSEPTAADTATATSTTASGGGPAATRTPPPTATATSSTPVAGSTEPLVYTLINNCPAEVGAWHVTFQGPANAVVDVPNGQTVTGQLPAGFYVMSWTADNGASDGPFSVYSGDGALEEALCP